MRARRVPPPFVSIFHRRGIRTPIALWSLALLATLHMTLSAPQPVRSALDLIGNTPLVELTRLDTGACRLFAKLESQNPGGSIKDRIGLSMIEAAEKSGQIKPGGTIVEATAGNTGLGL